ncbi:MAG: DUF302 domain-containing protein [Actinobacteria bacterium]|nr:MAG: DUF302 domain-containing protein [Actinomycetota bacterium]
MQFDYTVTTQKSFAEAVEAVQTALTDSGFRVQFVHDVQETLAEKGFEREPLTIIETCNAKHAHAVLAADPKIALMLPCPVVVYEQNGERFISTLKPSVIGDFYPEADIADAAAAVEKVLVGVIETAR